MKTLGTIFYTAQVVVAALLLLMGAGYTIISLVRIQIVTAFLFGLLTAGVYDFLLIPSIYEYIKHKSD